MILFLGKDSHLNKYKDIFKDRLAMFNKLKNNTRLISAYKKHYKNNTIDLINDWGMTYDPRKKSDEAKVMPFILNAGSQKIPSL